MICQLLTLQELAGREGPFKFILMEEGGFIFAPAIPGSVSFAQMAEYLHEHGTPIAAGSLMLFETQWHPVTMYVPELKVGCTHAMLMDLTKAIKTTLGKVMVKTAVFQNAECN